MFKFAAALAALLVVPVTQAQDAVAAAPLPAVTPAPTTQPIAAPAAADDPATAANANANVSAPAPCCRLAAGSAVELQLGESLSSARHKRGDRFALRLSQPLTVDGAEPILAGTPAVGEVVHGARSRGGGHPGELLIAGRYLEFNGRQIPLRGLSVGQSGRDQINGAMGASLLIGPFAMFVRGREIEIPADTALRAKLAQELELTVAGTTAATAPALPVSPSPTTAADAVQPPQE
ncbi:hypothetical protein ASE35_12440 [Lysobacter sp. Root916]|uniref:hypothetical protein n=1 Tax=Lysobacter sp. Root916 TaxID=1736606 RepID=UPI00071073EC|nr:hypothetical protein [Lysobacter sp. Root916]KRD31784.1 hypothetical protein ASE35_12440 [Lysobacter sp. Root916]